MKFNDEVLALVVNQSSSLLENTTKKLDQISSDIKTLEQFLKGFPFIVGVELEIPETGTILHDGKRLMFQNEDKNSLAYSKCRPLIEWDAVTRLKVAKYLPDFIKLCSEELKKINEE